MALGQDNIEFSCRPESDRYAPVRRTALSFNKLNPGGQLQRFVIHTHYISFPQSEVEIFTSYWSTSDDSNNDHKAPSRGL
jgi:hypothetical protein